MKSRNNPEILLIRLKKIRNWVFLILLFIFLIFVLFFHDPTRHLGISRDGIQTGEIEYFFPEELIVDEETAVSVSIRYAGRSKFIDNSDTLDSNSRDTLKVGELMKLELVDFGDETSPNFRITPITNQEQVIDTSQNGINIWFWSLIPLKPGEFELGIKSTNLVSSDYGLKNFDNPLVKRKVTVQSKLWYEFKEVIRKYWPMMIVGIGLGIWIILYLRAKRELRKLKIIPLSEFMKTEYKLRKYIQNDKLKSFFDTFRSWTRKYELDEYERKLTLIESTYNSNTSSFNMNTISYEEFSVNKSKAVSRILDLIDELKRNHTNHKFDSAQSN